MRQPQNSKGQLAKTAVNDTLIGRTIEFIWDSLTPWRDDPERTDVDSEEELNAQLHNFLEVRSREVFPMVYFQHEQRQGRRRRVDIAAKPVRTVVIESVIYTKYLPLFVIEGKRLPSPSKDREQEYVTGDKKLSGGIQRFKLGLHGKDHEKAVIVGYVQENSARHWYSIVNSWIAELAKTDPTDWTVGEKLIEFATANTNARARSVSEHPRAKPQELSSIKLFHFWIQCSKHT